MTITASGTPAAVAASATLSAVTSGDGDELVGTADAAKALRIDRRTLSRWAAAGHVTPAQRTVGGHLRWNLADLRRQVDELTRPS